MAGLIGVSSAEQGRYSVFYAALSGMERPTEYLSVFARSAVISENRNHITEEALKYNAEWVLYLDDDHILGQNTLTRLLEADKDVISAHYVQRQLPFNPVLMSQQIDGGKYVWKQLDPNETGIVKVAAAGAGCLLVKRKVLDALEPPYWRLGQINPASWGDDLDFCTRVRAAGFDIHCDLNNVIGHIMSGIVYPSHEDTQGWTADYIQDMGKPVLFKYPMAMPGDF